jgi:hypothetical protein
VWINNCMLVVGSNCDTCASNVSQPNVLVTWIQVNHVSSKEIKSTILLLNDNHTKKYGLEHLHRRSQMFSVGLLGSTQKWAQINTQNDADSWSGPNLRLALPRRPSPIGNGPGVPTHAECRIQIRMHHMTTTQTFSLSPLFTHARLPPREFLAKSPMFKLTGSFALSTKHQHRPFVIRGSPADPPKVLPDLSQRETG